MRLGKKVNIRNKREKAKKEKKQKENRSPLPIIEHVNTQGEIQISSDGDDRMGATIKPPKIPVPKINPQKIPCGFSEQQKFPESI